MTDTSRVRAALDALPEIRYALGLPEEPMTSLPIPVENGGVAALGVFLFPWNGLPPASPRLYPPIARMILSIDGRLLEGGPTTPADFGLPGPAGASLGEHDFAPPLSSEDYTKVETALEEALDRLLRTGIFWRVPATPTISADARAFRDAFERIVHRPLLPCYRAMNSQFFAWLEEVAPPLTSSPNPGDSPR